MTTPSTNPIPVIDLFAGPGGLSEGFASFNQPQPRFHVCLSIEKDEFAHQTLQLRAFYRQFPRNHVPKAYYDFLRSSISRTQLFDAHPDVAERATREAYHAELGETSAQEIDSHLSSALAGRQTWVLIGGPPCQAYSLVGRSRNKGNKTYVPAKDARHFLYREYLRIIAEHYPPIFVMENVKGILSARVNDEPIFQQILRDLKTPYLALPQNDTLRCYRYNIYSFVKPVTAGLFDDSILHPTDYIIKSERYGVPQARHRVILLGVRDDCNGMQIPSLQARPECTVKAAIDDLPRLRSGLSREDSPQAWKEELLAIARASWLNQLDPAISRRIISMLDKVRLPRKQRGAEFLEHTRTPSALRKWYHDRYLNGVCNHTTRGHIPGDLHRYFYAACYAREKGVSPSLADFPEALLPAHNNAREAIENGSLFSDRFRVQLPDRPSTTVTSHISKDGHYYIHYDPTQCRSLTVREAARLQTFPDNYFFCGPRTAQYHQVGNAVPPYLACQIAEIVWNVLRSHEEKS
jgi:DNA (cytosine-5)-methyltransferase 1